MSSSFRLLREFCGLGHHEWSQADGQQKYRIFESGKAFGKGRNFCCDVDQEQAGKGGEPAGSQGGQDDYQL